MSNVAQAVSVAGPGRVGLLGGRRVPWYAVAVLGLVGWLYAPILYHLVRQWWNDPNFSHGFFVPLFSVWVLWRSRERLKQIRLEPSAWGLPVIVASLLVLILGIFGAELFLSRVSLVFLLIGLVIFFFGWAMLRGVSFPLLFLVLMVPIPAILFSQITFPLQMLASKLAAHTLPFCGVPVLREGNVINLPAMPLEVAEACSGIRSLMSLATWAIMYSYLLEKRTSVRILLALASLPIAVAANAFRIVGTGLIVEYWDPQKAEGFFHAFSGLLVFLISLLMLFGLHQALRLVGRDREQMT
jgi:exosortase